MNPMLENKPDVIAGEQNIPSISRLYGPLESFYDKTWQPGDPELVE
jgi:hypothetical protein